MASSASCSTNVLCGGSTIGSSGPMTAAGDPTHRAQRPAREHVATVGLVRELQALAERAEGHGMLADHVARAERHHADLLAGALARHTLPAVHADLLEIAAERPGDDLGHVQRGAARRV